MTGGLPLAKLVRRVCDANDWPVTIVQDLPWDQLLAWSETKGGEISPGLALTKINQRREQRGLPPIDHV